MKHSRKRGWWRRATLSAGALVIAAAVIAAPKIRWLLTPQHMYVLNSSVTVGEGDLQFATWSPDGAHLLVGFRTMAMNERGENMQTGMRIVSWDRGGRAARQIWSSDQPVMLSSPVWLNGTSTVFLGAYLPSREAGPAAPEETLCLDAATGAPKWLDGIDVGLVEPSPTRGFAVVFVPRQDSPESDYVVVGAGGQILKRITAKGQASRSIVWNSDGTRWFAQFKDHKTKKIVNEELGADGVFVPVNEPLYQAVEPGPPEMWVHSTTVAAVQRKERARLTPVWLSTPQVTSRPDVLVSANARNASLSPANDAVFYTEGDIAKVQPIVRLSETQKKDMIAALRAVAISNAKQCALGLLMYANDADDMLPPGGSFDTVDPYIKNDDVMSDFVYAPPSDLLTTRLADPANTVVGYIDGPGGQAVAYVDGHVRWIPTP